VETDPKLEPIWRLAEPVALEAGLELVDVEYRREGHGTVLRLLIDKPGGVSLDELAAISRQVSDILDVETDAVPGPYTLEVSSPGVNRPLTRPAHFQAFAGKRVHVQTRAPLGDRRSFRGRLESVSSSGIVVVGDDGQSHAIPFAMIARAHYQHDFAPPARPRPARGARRAAAHQGS
jgi:ribosome maturation factor RimP